MTSTVTPGEFWGALGRKASPATIVTTINSEGIPAGFVGLSATHVSAAPAIMSIAVGASTSALASLRQSGVFVINHLAEPARDVWERFSAKDAPKGDDRFTTLSYRAGGLGAPVFDEITCAFECRVAQDIEVEGTHLILGHVAKIHRRSEATPIVFFGGAVLPLNVGWGET